MNEAPVLAVVGPTASGKTALSLPLAEALDAEIISMDSRQIYRGMDVGTAKVTPEERARVPHHGLDLVEPEDRYSAARFARDTRIVLDDVRARDRLPMLVGGTGFFLRALIDPIFREPSLDAERRSRLRDWLERTSVGELTRWARRLDPERAELAERGGRQRLARTLEMALLTGRPLSWWHEHAPREAPPIRARIVRLMLPREELYRRIDRRAERMIHEQGLLAEVRGLLEAGVEVDAPGMSGTGYRESAAVLGGEITVDEALDRIQRATRRYARRQETWFRHQLPGDVLQLDARRPLPEQVRTVVHWWRGIGGEPRG